MPFAISAPLGDRHDDPFRRFVRRGLLPDSNQVYGRAGLNVPSSDDVLLCLFRVPSRRLTVEPFGGHQCPLSRSGRGVAPHTRAVTWQVLWSTSHCS
jgi:hypothetical protein